LVLQIGQVAQRTGLTIDTIRFYEREALIPKPRRTSGGYRVYEQQEVERLLFIGQAQNLGFTLQEIRELLLIENSDKGGCSHVRDLVAGKIAQVKEKISELRRLESQLTKAQRLCSAALVEACTTECPVLDSLKPGHVGKELK
jgi:DNA-binding transcriptional MerR regulator